MSTRDIAALREQYKRKFNDVSKLGQHVAEWQAVCLKLDLVTEIACRWGDARDANDPTDLVDDLAATLARDIGRDALGGSYRRAEEIASVWVTGGSLTLIAALIAAPADTRASDLSTDAVNLWLYRIRAVEAARLAMGMSNDR